VVKSKTNLKDFLSESSKYVFILKTGQTMTKKIEEHSHMMEE